MQTPAMQSIQGIKRPYLMRFPSGKWGFVGSVPLQLAFEHKDGSELTVEEGHKVASFGVGLFKNIRTRTWIAAIDAMQAAQDVGYTAESITVAQSHGLTLKDGIK